MQRVNDRIKELRIKLQLTQEEFGEKIGLSKSGISNIENGTRNVSSRHIKLICNIFNANESWLVTGIDDGEKFQKLSEGIAHFEQFRKYLISLGYAISVEKVDESVEKICEEMKSANGTILGIEQIPVTELYTITLEKDRVKTTLSEEQFETMQQNIAKAVAFELFNVNTL
ncbi:helix-turn-helix transcriptional regulator [Chakrabartyella piscis]|uniref:helix-turn-helix domain-containing protein n=1 Tax=Chakrabartyella piscis TaxID=2918914 RepID=UPI002958C3BC|nr:helix-turn-helix transcriptional regulator [Chakrabartyella piscis]